MLRLERSIRGNTFAKSGIESALLDALGKRRVPDLARGTGADTDEVQEAMERIKLLEPCPGRAFLPGLLQELNSVHTCHILRCDHRIPISQRTTA